jgi:hypothetical protein
VSVGAPALVSNLFRSRFEDEGLKFGVTLLTLPAYFLLFEFLYLSAYGLSRALGKGWSFGVIYYALLPFFYVCCWIGWLLENKMTLLDLRISLPATLFLLFLILNVVSFHAARPFAEVSFGLKNERIDFHLTKLRPQKTNSSSAV